MKPKQKNRDLISSFKNGFVKKLSPKRAAALGLAATVAVLAGTGTLGTAGATLLEGAVYAGAGIGFYRVGFGNEFKKARDFFQKGEAIESIKSMGQVAASKMKEGLHSASKYAKTMRFDRAKKAVSSQANKALRQGRALLQSTISKTKSRAKNLSIKAANRPKR